MALSRHRSSGCLQSRHCHSTLSLSRARSSSALNRVQSRSMNLLMIQNNNNKNNRNGESTGVSGGGGKAGQQNKKNHNSTKSQKSGGNNNTSNVGSGNKCTMKTTSSDVLSLASSSSSNPRSDIDEDEGVATDATTDGNTGSKTKDIKANAGKRSKLQNNRTRINKEDGLTQGM